MVLFDFGGVVCQFTPVRRLAALARLSGLSADEVHQRIFASGYDLECDRGGHTLEQQCAGICERLAISASPHDLAGCWAQSMALNQDVLAIVARVRMVAVTALLTNNGPLVKLMMHSFFPRVVALFDQLCFSYEVMSVKPEPRAYLGTLERLGVTAEQAVFIDDSEQNVLGARAVGIDAMRFVSPSALELALQHRRLL